MIPFYAAIKRVFRLKRICPKCGKSQIIKPTQKTRTVQCNSCKANIPPPREG